MMLKGLSGRWGWVVEFQVVVLRDHVEEVVVVGLVQCLFHKLLHKKIEKILMEIGQKILHKPIHVVLFLLGLWLVEGGRYQVVVGDDRRRRLHFHVLQTGNRKLPVSAFELENFRSVRIDKMTRFVLKKNVVCGLKEILEQLLNLSNLLKINIDSGRSYL